MHNPPQYAFPDPRTAPGDEPLAMGGDLSPGRLLKAYSSGIFPWYSDGEPILWWSLDPRFVLSPLDCKINHGLRRELKRDIWKITFDQAFSEVIRSCKSMPRPEQDGTWITSEMIAAYEQLHEGGYAHSVECWQDGELAGGLYGVSLGGMFFGESMFHKKPNASKVAFAALVERLVEWDFALIDCQQPTDYLATFGAKCIPRDEFLDILEVALERPTRQGKW